MIADQMPLDLWRGRGCRRANDADMLAGRAQNIPQAWLANGAAVGWHRRGIAMILAERGAVDAELAGILAAEQAEPGRQARPRRAALEPPAHAPIGEHMQRA